MIGTFISYSWTVRGHNEYKSGNGYVVFKREIKTQKELEVAINEIKSVKKLDSVIPIFFKEISVDA